MSGIFVTALWNLIATSAAARGGEKMFLCLYTAPFTGRETLLQLVVLTVAAGQGLDLQRRQSTLGIEESWCPNGNEVMFSGKCYKE
jgi:hypothetical protein